MHKLSYIPTCTYIFIYFVFRLIFNISIFLLWMFSSCYFCGNFSLNIKHKIVLYFKWTNIRFEVFYSSDSSENLTGSWKLIINSITLYILYYALYLVLCLISIRLPTWSIKLQVKCISQRQQSSDAKSSDMMVWIK